MSGADDIAIIALIVSLIALVTTFIQLLQTVFGTAEGFRRTNKEIMGLFAYSRDRVFHPTELRYETRFSTPHFIFHRGAEDTSLISHVQDENRSGGLSRTYEPPVSDTGLPGPMKEKSGPIDGDDDHDQMPVRPVLVIDAFGDKTKDLKSLIHSSSRISKLQRFLQLFEHRSERSAKHLVSPRSRAYASGWLVLLEQLYEDSEKFHQNDDKGRYVYHRNNNVADTAGPDRASVLYPAIESHGRSWDLLPPDVVRPLASVSMSDLLTLCFRLRITISNFGQREFSADGFGNNLSSLQIQGLGMVLQYRYDKMKDNADVDLHASLKYIPSEHTDKLAFGIIPANKQLGTTDWPLSSDANGQHITQTMRQHLQKIGVSESGLRIVVSSRDPRPKFEKNTTNYAGELFDQALLLQAPFMTIDGLGIVKFQPPMPEEWFISNLRIRQGRLIFRQRLIEKLSDSERADMAVKGQPAMPLSISSFAGSKRAWVAHVFEFFRERYPLGFDQPVDYWPIIDKNAYNARSHDYLRQLRSAYTDVDMRLASLFHRRGYAPTYSCLLAAHFDMAITVHSEVNNVVRQLEENRSKHQYQWSHPSFRDVAGVPGVCKWRAEIVHRYVDHVMEERTVVEAYEKKSSELSQKTGLPLSHLEHDEIVEGWWLMMLRGCLWGMTHYPSWQPKLPYPSRYWEDNTLVFIA